MPVKPIPSDLPILPFVTAAGFEAFLDREHGSSRGIYLKVAKKSARIASITFAEATEVALCFGWINGQGKPFDDQWSLSRFTPRRPKSLWSKRNVDIVAMLVETRRMRPAGIAAVEAAKADGRWDRAYAGPATMTIPDDFAAALSKDSSASSYFNGLNKSDRFNVLWRVHTATPPNRANRVETLVGYLAAGKITGKRQAAVAAGKPPKRAVGRRASTAKTSASKRHEVIRHSASSPTFDGGSVNLPRRTGLRPRS